MPAEPTTPSAAPTRCPRCGKQNVGIHTCNIPRTPLPTSEAEPDTRGPWEVSDAEILAVLDRNAPSSAPAIDARETTLATLIESEIHDALIAESAGEEQTTERVRARAAAVAKHAEKLVCYHCRRPRVEHPVSIRGNALTVYCEVPYGC